MIKVVKGRPLLIADIMGFPHGERFLLYNETVVLYLGVSGYCPDIRGRYVYFLEDGDESGFISHRINTTTTFYEYVEKDIMDLTDAAELYLDMYFSQVHSWTEADKLNALAAVIWYCVEEAARDSLLF